jgi:hypothetical protein
MSGVKVEPGPIVGEQAGERWVVGLGPGDRQEPLPVAASDADAAVSVVDAGVGNRLCV